MGVYSGGLVIPRIFRLRFWGLIFGRAYLSLLLLFIIFFGWEGGGGGLLSEFYGIFPRRCCYMSERGYHGVKLY